MDRQSLSRVVAEVLRDCLTGAGDPIPVEVSARHAHLSQEYVEQLFGAGYRLTPVRELSQPGQFLCEERVRLVGPSGIMDHVAILGPARDRTQVEISAADGRRLGISPPLRMSGDTDGAADLALYANGRFVQAGESGIVAHNHIHMTPQDAARYGVANGEMVGIRVSGARPLVFEQVTVRVDASFRLAMHMDTDEGNACAWSPGMTGTLLKAGPLSPPAACPPQQTAPVHKESGFSVGPDWEGKVLTASTAQRLCVPGRSGLTLCRGTIITPLAADVLRDARVRITWPEEDGAS